MGNIPDAVTPAQGQNLKLLLTKFMRMEAGTVPYSNPPALYTAPQVIHTHSFCKKISALWKHKWIWLGTQQCSAINWNFHRRKQGKKATIPACQVGLLHGATENQIGCYQQLMRTNPDSHSRICKPFFKALQCITLSLQISRVLLLPGHNAHLYSTGWQIPMIRKTMRHHGSLYSFC